MITSKLSLVFVTIVIALKLSLANQRISAKKCKEYESITQIPYYVRSHLNFPIQNITVNNCQHKSVPLVTGGDNAIVYEFPHQALLGYKTTKIEWLCGGSLISSNFVMTAAHCVKKKPMPKVSYVKLGMLQSSSTNEFVRIYGVAKEICHPNYKPISYNFDIALLELNETVQFNYYIYPICLPTKQHDDPEAILTGFGRTGPDDALSENLQKVSLEYFSHDDCRKKHTNVDSETMICYGHHSEKKDSCKGDSGGPIQVRNDNQSMCTYTQIGIVSSGPRQCGTINVASVFTNVFHFLDWIENIVWKDEISIRADFEYFEIVD